MGKSKRRVGAVATAAAAVLAAVGTAPETSTETVAVETVKDIPAGELALQQRHPSQWKNVRDVTLRKADGTPLRVVVQCTELVAGARCEGTRDIAVQDLFQVKRCSPHQNDAIKAVRRARAKARRVAKKAPVAGAAS